MKGFVKPVLIVVVFLWVIGMVGAGYYLVQKRQTTESRADASFCPQQGFLPLNTGEVCPAGTEETTISPVASGGDTNQTPIRCCKSLITAESSASTGSQTQTDGDSTQTQTSSTGDTAQTQTDGDTAQTQITTDNSCPALPQLKVNVTCLNCIDRAE